MEAVKITYLNDIVYVYEDGGEPIATVHSDTMAIIWENSQEEPYLGATVDVLTAVAKIMTEEE